MHRDFEASILFGTPLSVLSAVRNRFLSPDLIHVDDLIDQGSQFRQKESKIILGFALCMRERYDPMHA